MFLMYNLRAISGSKKRNVLLSNSTETDSFFNTTTDNYNRNKNIGRLEGQIYNIAINHLFITTFTHIFTISKLKNAMHLISAPTLFLTP